VGSIEIGKDGDVAIFEGHPLSIYTIPVLTYVDGVKVFDRENDPDDVRVDVDPTAEVGMYEGQITGKDHIHSHEEVVDMLHFFQSVADTHIH